MAVAFGTGAGVNELAAMARRQSRLALVATAPAAAVAGIAAVYLIPQVLPAFAGSVLPTTVLLAGMVVLAASSGWGNLLTVIGAQMPYLRAQTMALVVALVSMLVGVRLTGPTGVAVGFALGQVALLVAVRRESARQLAHRLAPTAQIPDVQ
jgi:O-antigen/teichoic acid export membrane protein